MAPLAQEELALTCFRSSRPRGEDIRSPNLGDAGLAVKGSMRETKGRMQPLSGLKVFLVRYPG
jgi:hypothetical protein